MKIKTKQKIKGQIGKKILIYSGYLIPPFPQPTSTAAFNDYDAILRAQFDMLHIGTLLKWNLIDLTFLKLDMQALQWHFGFFLQNNAPESFRQNFQHLLCSLLPPQISR